MSSTTKDILSLLASGSITTDEANSRIEKLNKKNSSGLRYKVSQKGAISFYGLRRMPITLYIAELESIIDTLIDENEAGEPFSESNSWGETFTEFLCENKKKLKRKD
jgi:hypothetical protein